MALIQYSDSGGSAVTPEYAARIWLILNGEITGEPTEQAVALRTKRVLMDWKHPATPKSYLIANRHVVAESAIEAKVTLEALPETDFWTTNDQWGEK